MFKWRAGFLVAATIVGLASQDVQAQSRRVQAQAPAAAPVTLSRSDADLYAATLAGRFAQGTSNPSLAARAWSRAYLRRPTDPDLFERAIESNLQAGDVATAVRLAKVAPASIRDETATLLVAVDAFTQGRYQDVTRTLAAGRFQPSQRVIADHLAAYALLGLNKSNDAVELTAKVSGIPALDKAGLTSRALILDAAGRGAEAGILFQSSLDSNIAWPVGVRAYCNWLVANGRKQDAVSVYQRLVRAGGLEAGGFAAALVQVQSSASRPQALDLRARAASGLLTLVQSLAAEGRGGPPLILYNLVAYLDPRLDGAALALANQLSTESKADLARPMLERIAPSSLDFLVARTELVWLVYDTDQNEAVRIARDTLAAQSNTIAAKRLLADILAASRNDREAEALYSSLITQSITQGQPTDEVWPLYFGRGGTRERLGDWGAALADLRVAKAAAPNQPNVLNYLGYALANRGESLDEAIPMLQAAVRLRPRSGAIMDSLGWAYFRAGRYEEAVATLETAAGMSPALAEITDHLGDAYWRSGREDEARLEWNRALRLELTTQQRDTITGKIRDGLPIDPAQAARRALAAQTSNTTQ